MTLGVASDARLFDSQLSDFYSPPGSRGTLLALCSGVITSGIGYVVWYRALKDLGATEAGIVQLAVPVVAAFGGVTILGEPLSARFVIAGVFILGGVALSTLKTKTVR